MMQRYSTIWVQIRSGLGKMNSETLKATHTNCHKAITATSKIHGNQA